MASYEVRLTRSARKELGAVDSRADRARLVAAMERLASNPRPAGSVKLATSNSTYRIRVGNHRVIYEVLDRLLVVDVIRIGHRREVYR
ncbi:MAG: type II toxin-antitoxin system RelE/ParE family toxin [Phycisphaerales bacterium]|nr:type II toxin-antitoxin system RelE/ParE family toxin [Phycisphaerales bacterium]